MSRFDWTSWGICKVWELAFEEPSDGIIKVKRRPDVFVVIEKVCSRTVVVGAAVTLYAYEC